jgi:hypothetical protein
MTPNPSKADLRRSELMDLLEERHPESRALLEELGEKIAELWCEAETFGIRRQATVIMAAIRGDLRADPGCTPRWDDRREYEAGAVSV